MDFDIIKGVLNSNLNIREKLAKIEEIVQRAEQVERLAIEYAYKKGRKPTWDDRARAIKLIAEEEKINLGGINQEYLGQCLTAAVQWLKETIERNEGWEVKAGFEPFIVNEKPPENIRPLSMLLVAPWEISTAILALRDWIKHFSSKDNEAMNLIKDGAAYLRQIQLSLDTGGLGDSIWMKGMHSYNKKSAGNTLETSVAISAWRVTAETVPCNYTDAIKWGLEYLIGNRNKDGGWGFRKGWKSDLKSSSIALMVLATSRMRSELSFLSDEEFAKLNIGGLEWILKSQGEDGSWKSYRKKLSRDTAIFPSFYAIEALAVEKSCLQIRNSGESINQKELEDGIDFGLWRALQWYESSQRFIKDGDKEGWGWQNHLEFSNIENTAAGLTVLLDTGWLTETSSLLERALEWLLNQRDSNNLWYANTPLVLIALIRALEPKARLYNILKR